MATKYIGWGIAFELNGQKALTIVPAKTKREACDQIEIFGLKIVDESQMRRVCIVKYPGPEQVKEMKSQNWDKEIRMLECE